MLCCVEQHGRALLALLAPSFINSIELIALINTKRSSEQPDKSHITSCNRIYVNIKFHSAFSLGVRQVISKSILNTN